MPPARLLLVGNVGCGKTTLVQRLTDQELTYSKTQAATFSAHFIDTPGEYLAHGYLRHALHQISVESSLIALLQSASETRETIPPGFSTFFTRPVIGVVTKIDLADEAQIESARARLRRAGAREIMAVSALTGQGVTELAARLAQAAR